MEEYIWMKGGKEWKRTSDLEGKIVWRENLSANTHVTYSYFGGGSTKVMAEKHYTNNVLYRGDKPSEIMYDRNGDVSSESWTTSNGDYGRDGEGAYVRHYEGDVLVFEQFTSGDIALKRYHENGQVEEIEYRYNGNVPRNTVKGDPAKLLQRYNEDGTLTKEIFTNVRYSQFIKYHKSYYVSGILGKEQWVRGHAFELAPAKDGKPSEIIYFTDGGKYRERWADHEDHTSRLALREYDREGNVVKEEKFD